MGERFEDFRQERIELAMFCGGRGVNSVVVKGLVQGCFAIHRPVERGFKRKGWKITHLPTGLALPSLIEVEADAVRHVRAINKLRNDWNETELKGRWFEQLKSYWIDFMRPAHTAAFPGSDAPPDIRLSLNAKLRPPE